MVKKAQLPHQIVQANPALNCSVLLMLTVGTAAPGCVVLNLPPCLVASMVGSALVSDQQTGGCACCRPS